MPKVLKHIKKLVIKFIIYRSIHVYLNFKFIIILTSSQFAARMLPILDPAMLTTVNFFLLNVLYMVRRVKLAWLLLVQPSAFFRIQDGGLRHLEFRPIFNF